MYRERTGSGIIVRNDRARFQRHGGVATEGELLLHHVGRMREGLVDGAVVELSAKAGVVGAAGIDHRPTRFPRTVDIDNEGKILVIDLDQFQRVFRDGPALGNDGDHGLPGPDHTVQRQWQLRGGGHALEMIERAGPGRADSCQISASRDKMHALERAGFVDVDRNDLRMRMRATQERGMEHARQLEIANVAPASGQQPFGVRPRHGTADIGIRTIERGQRRDHVASPPWLRALATASIASTIAS
ncbi:hypothetical protein ACVME8_008614 [Bradyrhizobium diazoefficiens]